MKTDAIREIIDEFLRLVHKGVVVYEDEPDNDWKDCASDARAELATIREEVEALNFTIEYLSSDIRAGTELVKLRNEENAKLREMLAFAYCPGATLYADDGELQDNRAFPSIDFKRNDVITLQTKMTERAAISVVTEEEADDAD